MAPLPHPETDAATGAERRTARRGWSLALPSLVALLACTVLAVLWAGRGEFGSHHAYLLGGADARIAMDYASLSPALDEAALQRHFAPAVLHCVDAGSGGGRLCEAALAQADGVAAARLRATLAQGRLQQIELFVPWWAHHRAAQALTAQRGAPTAFYTPKTSADPPAALLWADATGTVRVDRDPGWNPLRWSVLRWVAGATR